MKTCIILEKMGIETKNSRCYTDMDSEERFLKMQQQRLFSNKTLVRLIIPLVISYQSHTGHYSIYRHESNKKPGKYFSYFHRNLFNEF